MALKGRTGRATLSDRLKGMRFMREREDADLKQKQAKEAKEREESARWVVDDPAVHDLSAVVILDDGDQESPVAARQSFGHFNLAVERRMHAVDPSGTDADADSADSAAETDAKPGAHAKSPDVIVVKEEEDEVEGSPVQPSPPGSSEKDAAFSRYRPTSRRDSSGSASRRGKRAYSGSSSFNPRKKFKSPGNNNRPLFKR